MKKTIALTTLAATALFLGACASAEPTTPPPASESTATQESVEETVVEGDNDLEPTTWTMEVEGATYEVDPADMGPYAPGDTFSLEGTEAIGLVTFGADGPEEMTTFLSDIGLAEGSYSFIRLDVDNRQGTEKVNVTDIEVFDEAGESYEYSDAFIALNDRGPTMTYDYDYVNVEGIEISEEEYWSQTEQLNALSEEYGDSYVQPGQVATVWLIGPALPESFTSIIGIDSYYDVDFLPATKL